MTVKGWPKIKKTTNHGNEVYIVDARFKGKGERRFFSKKAEAEGWAQTQRTLRINQGHAGVSLPERLRIEALECHELLAPHNARLRDAVDFFLRHAKLAGGQRLLHDLVNEFLDAKRTAGRRDEYLRIQASILGLFDKAHPEAMTHEITSTDIERWLASRGGSLRTRSNYQNDVRNLFNFAVKRGYAASNPAEILEKITLDDLAIEVLSVSQANGLLKAAQVAGGKLTPFIAIGLFAGLRTREIAVLDWKDVSLTEKNITVHAAKTKTRSRRTVEISNNLVAWLAPLAKAAGPVTPEKYRTMFEAIRKDEKLTPWPRNAMRHSFASYYYALTRDETKTQAQMGHDDTEVLLKNYRKLVKPKAAREYFALIP